MVWLELLAASLSVLVADQVSKRLVLAQPRFRVAPARRAFVAVHCILNRRAAIVPLRAPWLLVGVWMVCAALALLLLSQGLLAHSTSAAIGIGMALGGVTGNLLDLLRRGGIVDFIAIHPWVFNVADAAIVSGLALALMALV